jgi:chloramphenicol 3-O phosphotransferase
MTAPGQIVVLNGAPRAGKSSIVAAVQATFDGLWMNLGVDVARSSAPDWCQPAIGLRPGEPNHVAAPHVALLYAAAYESIAAHSRLGLHVVAEFGHHDADVLFDCARRLDELPALLVGVRCPIEVIMERRNASPSDSYVTGDPNDPPEPVRRWQERVHAPGVYDLEVDTSELTPEQCADAIRVRLDAGVPGTAFSSLAKRSSMSAAR